MMFHLTLKSVSGLDTEHFAFLALRALLFTCSNVLPVRLRWCFCAGCNVVALDSHFFVYVALSVLNSSYRAHYYGSPQCALGPFTCRCLAFIQLDYLR